MDPQGRMLQEHAYEAIMDAGIHPKTMRGSRTGVFVGCCFCESEKYFMYGDPPKDGLGLSGNSQALLANRISFTLGLEGPSMVFDTSCSSSMVAIDSAFTALRNGVIDSAIVGGTNIVINPLVSLQNKELGLAAPEGISRPFDENTSGLNRSETICLVFIQRRRDAKRVYADFVYSSITCTDAQRNGYKYSPSDQQIKLLRKFYEAINISPSMVSYVEAHATGIIEADRDECNAIDKVFCADRKKPLLVGSVKSNMGHAEASSGMCSIAKILIAFENQKIPPNINFERSDIPSLVEGRLAVVNEATSLEGPLVGVNSLGFGGSICHALFRSNPKEKVNHGIPDDDIPRLVCWSGRTEDAIKSVMESVTKQPLDAEFVALLQNSQMESLPANIYRGYGVFIQNGNEENATCVGQSAQHFSGVKHPVVFVYSGMGSQWVGMGKDLMKIPIFSDAVAKCHKALIHKGLDIKEIITSDDPTMFDNILHSFVGIAAIQIGLTDILWAMGMEPDFIIGHSVGELGCAYADKCFTAEEMILAAYSRGMASIETKVVLGSMAAVGVGYSELKKMLPEDIEVACHNNFESSTISGPAESVSKFVEHLKSQNIFAKEVACSNIAFHSRYIQKMGPKLLSKLEEVLKVPMKRSSKWISSSYALSRRDEPESQFSSAQYHTNNLLSPVLFEEASALLPKNCVMIEIAPHGLLQAILKKTLPEAVNISLTQRSHKHNDQFLLGAIGKIYSNGYDLILPAVYPPVEFPVSRGTPMISPSIKWDHSEDWFVASFDTHMSDRSGERMVKISLSDKKFEYLAGHAVDGRHMMPATEFLFLAWNTMATILNKCYYEFSVEFEDIKFLRPLFFTKDNEVNITTVIQPGSGRFEIFTGTSALVTGIIRSVDKVDLAEIQNQTSEAKVALNSSDFYKELHLRGHQYDGSFKSVVEGSSDGLYGRVKWASNWTAFLDCLTQIQILGQATRSIVRPTSIRKITIDTSKHLQSVSDNPEKIFEVFVSHEMKTIRSEGVEIVDMQTDVVNRREPIAHPVLEYHKFIPFHQTPTMDGRSAVRMIVQLAIENDPMANLKAVEVDGLGKSILSDIRDAVSDLPLVTSELTLLTSRNLEREAEIDFKNEKLSSQSNCNLIISSHCINKAELFMQSASCFGDQGLFICREKREVQLDHITLPSTYRVISSISTECEILVVLQYVKKETRPGGPSVVRIADNTFEWVDKVKAATKNGSVVLVAESSPSSGLIKFVNSLRKETKIQCVFIDDPKAPKFKLDDTFYRKQLELGLAINVLRNGTWGSIRSFRLPQDSIECPVAEHCFVDTLVKSNLSSLKWISGNVLQNESELVKVQCASVSPRDVTLATGKHVTGKERSTALGIEYSGLTTSGRRVMGMASSAMASHVEADKFFTFTCPDDWSLSQAVTVPCAYATVYAALFITIRIEKDKSILIHSGTSAVGLAAIRVASAYGLEVFTTVGSGDQKAFVLNEFPGLNEDHIGNSSDTSFENMVQMKTKGKGVDFVLNSLSGEKLLASIRCLGKCGKFLEIGTVDIRNDTEIGLASFMNELSFHVIMTEQILEASEKDKSALKELLERDIKSGIVKPLKANIFKANQLEEAFRLVATENHIGKIVLKIRENESDNATLPISVSSRFYCDQNLCYIVIDDSSDLGLEFADWLVLRGCRKLVLSSNGALKSFQSYRIRIWESQGVQVISKSSAASTKSDCDLLIRESMRLSSVGGIFNFMSPPKDNQELQSKTIQHLDELTRTLCNKLKHFICFSSVSWGVQSKVEQIMSQRHNLGLPAKAINWSPQGGVLVKGSGILHQEISMSLENLDSLLTAREPIVSSMLLAVKLKIARRKIRSNPFELLLKCLDGEKFDDKTILKLDSGKSSKTPALIIPGLEGMVNQTLCKIGNEVDFPTSVLQISSTSYVMSIVEIIDIIEKDAIDYFSNSNKFHLIAHSFGCYVALLLAEKLEKLGKTGQITFIDGAPGLMKAMVLENFKGQIDDECIRNSVLAHIITTVVKDVSEDFGPNVFKQPKWSDKTAMIVNALNSASSYDEEESTAVMNALVNRIKMIIPTQNTISSLHTTTSTLIKPSTPSATSISENYAIDENFKKKTSVEYLDGDHFTILENPKLIEILNRLQLKISC